MGIKLVHSKAGRPEGRGKIERYFQFVGSSFKPEAYDLINAGKIQTLEQLNRYFQIWLDSFYHERRHGETKQSPKTSFEENEHPLVYPSVDEIKEAFLWEEARKVDKTGCISFQGNRYEVEQNLVGKEITIRFNPYELEHLQIWEKGKRYKDALPLNVHRNIDRRIEKESDTETEPQNRSGLNYLELTEPQYEKRKKEQLGKMSYSKLMGENQYD
ncbi:Mu transposase C-terminal domain-containing protein [Bacillota bacterium Lsc_1132]